MRRGLMFLRLATGSLVVVALLSTFAPSANAHGLRWYRRRAHLATHVIIRDSQTLLIGAGCSSDEPTARVSETPAHVRVRVVYSASDNVCGGRNLAVILQTPIGDRTIVDAKTGQAIPIFPNYGPP